MFRDYQTAGSIPFGYVKRGTTTQMHCAKNAESPVINMTRGITRSKRAEAHLVLRLKRMLCVSSGALVAEKSQIMETDYRAEYARLRALGWTAHSALYAARVRSLFDGRDDVRLLDVPDDEPYDPGEGETQAERARTRRRLEREGHWRLEAQVRCTCGAWRTVDSVGGFIGEDWRDSGYDTDLMREALREADA